MDQSQLRQLAKLGLQAKRLQLQQELLELNKLEQTLVVRRAPRTTPPAPAPPTSPKKSMWTPERRAALSATMKARAALRKK
jgi:hypothetical protein